MKNIVTIFVITQEWVSNFVNSIQKRENGLSVNKLLSHLTACIWTVSISVHPNHP